MTRHAVGIMNGNFRNGAYYHRKQEISRSTQKPDRRFKIEWAWNMRRLKRIDPDWESWYDSRPEQTCGQMLPLVKQRIEELKRADVHPVEESYQMDIEARDSMKYDTDVEFCSGAEPQHISPNHEEFTQADERERRDLYTMGMGG